MNQAIRVLMILVATVWACRAKADNPNIVSHLTADSAVVLEMPAGLNERLQFVEIVKTVAPKTKKVDAHAGYRVQVFSDNNPRTAKSEASSKAQMIAARFPQYRTYKKYSAPYWRLRVGDFKTQQEANNAAAALRRVFPQFSKEIRVVQDRINVTE